MLIKYITKYFHRRWVGFYITLIFLVKDWFRDGGASPVSLASDLS